jgi:hypothetical protein
MEWKFNADKKNIEKRYHEEIARLSENVHPRMKELIGENYNEDYFIIDEIFARQMRYSVLVTIYTILEMALNDLCNQLRRINELAVELDDLTGAGIDRAKRYLKKVCQIDFPDQSREWNEINKLNKIRNCIVHTQGNILEAKNTEELKNIVTNTKGLSIERDRYIKIEPSYIEKNEKLVRDFLTEIFDKAF